MREVANPEAQPTSTPTPAPLAGILNPIEDNIVNTIRSLFGKSASPSAQKIVGTPTNLPPMTPTPTVSAATNLPISTPSPALMPTPPATPISTPRPTAPPSPTPTMTATPTATPTSIPSPTATYTPTPTATGTPTPTVSYAPSTTPAPSFSYASPEVTNATPSFSYMSPAVTKPAVSAPVATPVPTPTPYRAPVSSYSPPVSTPAPSYTPSYIPTPVPTPASAPVTSSGGEGNILGNMISYLKQLISYIPIYSSTPEAPPATAGPPYMSTAGTVLGDLYGSLFGDLYPKTTGSSTGGKKTIIGYKPVTQYVKQYTSPSKTSSSKTTPSIPSNYTGFVGTTPYLQGKAQTAGGGYYTDPNTGKTAYSAGYHGSGGGGSGGSGAVKVISTKDGKPVISSSSPTPGNFTGWKGDQPYVNGQAQTSGGGFTPDGSYSAGYHGGGGASVDMGPWGTGVGMGPMVNGTVQTGGGGFTPDGSYSAGYHGSGEHPEITGESLPGIYGPTTMNGILRQGSFGPVNKPDLSNSGKVTDFLDYLTNMGYDVTGQYGGVNWRSRENSQKLNQMYEKNGGNFDAIAFMNSIATTAEQQKKTQLLKQATSNPMMPTSQALAILGGVNYANLGAGLPTTPGTTAYAPGADIYGTGVPYAWTPANAFGAGGAGGQGVNPTGPYAGWTGADVAVPDYAGAVIDVKTGEIKAAEGAEGKGEEAAKGLTTQANLLNASVLGESQPNLVAAQNAILAANRGYRNIFGRSLFNAGL